MNKWYVYASFFVVGIILSVTIIVALIQLDNAQKEKFNDGYVKALNDVNINIMQSLKTRRFVALNYLDGNQTKTIKLIDSNLCEKFVDKIQK